METLQRLLLYHHVARCCLFHLLYDRSAIIRGNDEQKKIAEEAETETQKKVVSTRLWAKLNRSSSSTMLRSTTRSTACSIRLIPPVTDPSFEDFSKVNFAFFSRTAYIKSVVMKFLPSTASPSLYFPHFFVSLLYEEPLVRVLSV